MSPAPPAARAPCSHLCCRLAVAGDHEAAREAALLAARLDLDFLHCELRAAPSLAGSDLQPCALCDLHVQPHARPRGGREDALGHFGGSTVTRLLSMHVPRQRPPASAQHETPGSPRSHSSRPLFVRFAVLRRCRSDLRASLQAGIDSRSWAGHRGAARTAGSPRRHDESSHSVEAGCGVSCEPRARSARIEPALLPHSARVSRRVPRELRRPRHQSERLSPSRGAARCVRPRAVRVARGCRPEDREQRHPRACSLRHGRQDSRGADPVTQRG